MTNAQVAMIMSMMYAFHPHVIKDQEQSPHPMPEPEKAALIFLEQLVELDKQEAYLRQKNGLGMGAV